MSTEDARKSTNARNIRKATDSLNRKCAHSRRKGGLDSLVLDHITNLLVSSRNHNKDRTFTQSQKPRQGLIDRLGNL